LFVPAATSLIDASRRAFSVIERQNGCGRRRGGTIPQENGIVNIDVNIDQERRQRLSAALRHACDPSDSGWGALFCRWTFNRPYSHARSLF
jgi:hypothetical protein